MPQLSELSVEITAKGLAEAQAQIRSLTAQLAAARKPAQDMQDGLDGVRRQAQLTGAALGGLATAVNSIGLGGLTPLIALAAQLLSVQRAATAAAIATAAAVAATNASKAIPVANPVRPPPPVVRQLSTAMAVYDPEFAAAQARKSSMLALSKPPVLPPIKPPVLPPVAGAAGGMGLAGLGAVGAVAAVVAAAVSSVLGMIGDLKDKMLGLARAGFEGTVEMNRYQFAMKLISREVAGALVPALNTLTSFLMGVQRTIASIGPQGQRMFAGLLIGVMALSAAVTVLAGAVAVLVVMLSPVGMIFFAVAGAMVLVGKVLYDAWQGSSQLRASVGGLKDQFLSLLKALGPVLDVLGQVNGVMIQAFIIAPLIRFIDQLKTALAILEKMAKFAALLLPRQAPQRPEAKTAVTLNQTGEESAQGTYQRIQQTILSLGAMEERTEPQKQTQSLNNIEKWLMARFGGTAPNAEPPPVGSIIGGAVPPGAAGRAWNALTR